MKFTPSEITSAAFSSIFTLHIELCCVEFAHPVNHTRVPHRPNERTVSYSWLQTIKPYFLKLR